MERARHQEWPALAKVKRLARASFGRVGPLFEFAGIGCAAAATVCCLYWLISLCTPKTDIGLMFRVEDEFTFARGAVTISTILSSRPGQRGWVNPSPPCRWAAPGLEIEHLEDYAGRTWLTVKFSLLIPGLVFAILAAFFIRRHKRARKVLAAARISGAGASGPRPSAASD